MIDSRPHNTHVYGEEAFWLKKGEEALSMNERLTVIIRLDDRTNEERTPMQFVSRLKPIPVFFIEKEGDQSKGVAANFKPDDGTTVEVVAQKVVTLGAITDNDLYFKGGSAVPRFASEVRNYLEQELAPGKKFLDDQVITLSYIQYLPKAF